MKLFSQTLSLLSGKFPIFVALAATLVLAGCVSSRSSSGYVGPSISSVADKRDAASKDVKKASRELRTSKRALRKLERQIKRDNRTVKRKRVSNKRRKAAEARLKKSKRELRSAKRQVRKAQRSFDRAKSKEKRAIRAVAKAKRRKAEAERRFAEAKRREAKKQKELALAEKKKQQAEAQKEALRDEPRKPLGDRLFSLSDPALANVNDYGARIDGSFPIAAIPVNKINKRLLRQQVNYRTSHKVGTLVVDPHAKYLYLVQSGGKAMRYGIGVGKAGFEWSGEAHVGWKQEWPKWTPPVEMIERRPELAKYCADCGGMPGGPDNPLGARALYLMQGNVDTLYRLHGTPQWNSIGTAASSGCIRLMNQDIIDLYGRVPHGTKVVVL